MKILHISDTHGKHFELPPLPDADVIVHSGDFTFAGSESEAYDFMNWFCDLPYAQKIFVAGNHDMCMYGADSIEGLPDDVHYLNHTSIVIAGYKFFGLSMFMEDYMEGNFAAFYQQIPYDTDILVTHQPPYGICDLADYGHSLTHQGDEQLLKRVKEVAPRCHLFGHEHDAMSIEKQGNTIFSNASVLDRQYHLVGKPRLIDIQ